MKTIGHWASASALLALAACSSGTSSPSGTNGAGGSNVATTAPSGTPGAQTPPPGGKATGSSGNPGGTGSGSSSGGSGGFGSGSGSGTGAPPSSGTPAAGTGASGSDAGVPSDAGVGSDAATASEGGTDAAASCDRPCLLAQMDAYLKALIARDPTQIHTSSSLKYTDNGATAQPGQGLWQTASALVPDERLDFADPVNENVTSQLVVNENGSTPVLYMVRLKVDGGQITEIESETVRQADAANGFFTPSNLKPQPVFLQAPDSTTHMTRDELTSLLNDYLDYLDGMKTGSQVAFDDNCTRYENGVATAMGIASFQAQSWSFQVTRRILVIDEEAQIAWGMFPFMMSDPALVVGEAFKMLGGKIMMIQAVMAYMPNNQWN